MTKLSRILIVRPITSYLSQSFSYHSSSEGDYDLQAAKQFAEDKTFQSIARQYMRKWVKGQGVLVAQPFILNELDVISEPELRFQEACSLIRSVPNWRVIDGGLFPCSTFRRQEFFTGGIIDKLNQIISANPLITSLFVAVDKLQGYQQHSLEQLLKVPVVDRFSVILEIFRHYAKTGESMLQLQLAEIPYIKSRLSQYHINIEKPSYGRGFGGSGDRPIDIYRRVLDKRAKDIKLVLDKISQRRQQIINRRNKLEIPSIAVIGYTNSGKTSLIKTLSNKDNLIAEDRLFATLDVTAHPFRLPSFENVLFLDSIGFISNIPLELMDSFNTTFKDVAMSNLLLHVYDISHPDLKNQINTVYTTCQQLNIPQKMISSMVNVGNKVDLLDEEDKASIDETLIKPDHLRCSVTEKINLPQLISTLDTSLARNIDLNLFKLRVPNGGQEYTWLCRESKIVSATPDERDANYLYLTLQVTPSKKEKFVHTFGKKLIVEVKT